MTHPLPRAALTPSETRGRGASVPLVSQPVEAPQPLRQVLEFALVAMKNVRAPDGVIKQ